MSITKKIHYCWLGSAVPASVLRQVAEWKKMCPDYEFYEWNSHNVDYSDYPFWKRVSAEKRWGFASDIVSFDKVYQHGGFYLDCDVIMRKPLDSIPFNGGHLLMGYMYDCALSGGFFYAPPKHPLIARILDYYKDLNPVLNVVNNTIITDCINNNVDAFLLNGRKFVSEEDRITIFPKEYFCQPSFIASKPYVVDQFAGSWKDGSKGFLTNRGEKNFYRTMRRKINLFRSLLCNEYRNTYLWALLGRKVLKPETWRLEKV